LYALPHTPNRPARHSIANRPSHRRASEQACLEHLRSAGKSVVEIGGGDVDWRRDAARTEAAMRAGTEVIYQGVLVDAPWRGIAESWCPASAGRPP
jgi:hypothetical protein